MTASKITRSTTTNNIVVATVVATNTSDLVMEVTLPPLIEYTSVIVTFHSFPTPQNPAPLAVGQSTF